MLVDTTMKMSAEIGLTISKIKICHMGLKRIAVTRLAFKKNLSFGRNLKIISNANETKRPIKSIPKTNA
jgi:hypothetical protein